MNIKSANDNHEVKLSEVLIFSQQQIGGLHDDKLQEAVMQSPVEALATLDKARETAKRLEAAQTARRKMNQTRKAMSVTTPDDPSTPTPTWISL